MVPEGGRISSFRPLFYSVSIVTFVILTISTSFAVVDAADTGNPLASWKGIAFAGAIFDGFALCSVVILTISMVSSSNQWAHRWLFLSTGAALAVLAAVFSLIVVVQKKNYYASQPKRQASDGDNGRHIHLISAEFALWTLAISAELVFYTFVVLHTTSSHDRGVSFIAEKRKAPQRPPTPPTPLRIVAPPYALPETGMPAPDFDTSKKNRRPSWRNSLQQAVRPRNSRQGLLAPRTSSSRDSSILSDTRSIATTAQSDPFDSWDTSNVDYSIREALNSPTIPSRGRTLETIPGSRPASPAKALEGPFQDQPSFTNSPASSILERERDRPTTSLSRHERPATAQSTYSKRTFIPGRDSRPTSPSMMNESHIHPLFRSDSPTPAPGTTPGTVVTASPIGGQILPPPSIRSPSRMRNSSGNDSRGSRSRAPSPATFTSTRENSLDERPSFSSIAEVRSTFAFNRTDTMSSEGGQESAPSSRNPTMTSMSTSNPGRKSTNSIISRSHNRSRSCSPSPSPINRPMTPPIPEFILSASRERLSTKSSYETVRPER